MSKEKKLTPTQLRQFAEWALVKRGLVADQERERHESRSKRSHPMPVKRKVVLRKHLKSAWSEIRRKGL